MEELALLQASLPEVAALAGIAQSPPHYEDVLTHTRHVLDQLVRLQAAFFKSENIQDPALAYARSILAGYLPRLLVHLERPVEGGINGHLILRLGVLFHDVGKKVTRRVEEDGRIRFLWS